jgi:hypothetical protein
LSISIVPFPLTPELKEIEAPFSANYQAVVHRTEIDIA